MSHRYRIPNPSRLAVRQIRTKLEKMRSRLLTQEGGNLSEGMQRVWEIFGRLLPKLGRATFDPSYLGTDTDPDPVEWNRNMEEIEDDLNALYDEIREITSLRQEVSNAAAMNQRELMEKANLASSLVTDLRLTSGQLDQEIIVGSDDFVDVSKIDDNFPLQHPPAEVNATQGAMTLGRTKTVNVVTEGATVEITPVMPSELVNQDGGGRLPTGDNTKRFYEGLFYAPIGEARPEGGRWHTEEKVRPGVVVGGEGFYTIPPGISDSVFDQFPDLRPDDEDPESRVGLPLRPEDIVVIDRGASLAELLEVRQRMLDGSPESFWECEFVVDAPQLDQLIQDREDAIEEELENVFSDVTPAELRARASRADIDKYDFGIDVVIRMQRRSIVNFLTINPMNFNETAWLEITEVSTAADKDDAFLPIDGFTEGIFENVLTDEANVELSDGEAKTVLSPSKYGYRGQGVYTFAPRQVSRIRIRIKQRIPVPANYERVVVQLTRTLSASESSFSGSGGGMM